MVPLAAGPALGALAAAMRSRRLALLATAVCAGIVATFVDIGARRAVPGANDNLSGVTALLALARSLQREPVRGLRVLLVSTGSEEALMEGMRAFLARHAGELSASRTWLLCLDTIGSPRLVLPGAEGMLDTRAHDPMLRTLVADAARDHGVPLATEMRMRLGTDAYVAMRHGIPAALLTSVDRYGGLSNYHWPTDTPDRVDYGTLAGAVTLCDAVVRRLAARADGLRT
jgi:Zn-dependent M28 family amino/carboxypeptidase